MKRFAKVLGMVCICALVILGQAMSVEAASKVRLSKKATTVYVGTSSHLKVLGTKKKVSWKSSNKKVATVSTRGKVVGKSAGKAYVYAKVSGKTYKCKITVKYPLNKTKASVYIGEQIQLKISGIKGKVTWSSKNRNVATVSTKGKVLGRGIGKTYIYAKVGGKTYKCMLTVKDIFTIKKYKGLKIAQCTPMPVTDEEVEDTIRSNLIENNLWKMVTDRPAQAGDQVVIDYVGTINGSPIDGGSATEQFIVLGSGSYIRGFEEGIIGHSTGETFKIYITFPSDYGVPELEGENAVFTITLHAIRVLPELTDQFVLESQDILGTEATTVSEYRAFVRKDLEASNKDVADNQKEQAVWEALIKQCTVAKYPKDMYEKQAAEIDAQYSYYAQMYGMSVDELISSLFGISKDTMIKDLIKQELAVQYIAEKEKLSLTTKEYKTRLGEYALEYGYTSTEELEKQVGKTELEKVFLQEKVTEFLVKHCIEVE